MYSVALNDILSLILAIYSCFVVFTWDDLHHACTQVLNAFKLVFCETCAFQKTWLLFHSIQTVPIWCIAYVCLYCVQMRERNRERGTEQEMFWTKKITSFRLLQTERCRPEPFHIWLAKKTTTNCFSLLLKHCSLFSLARFFSCMKPLAIRYYWPSIKKYTVNNMGGEETHLNTLLENNGKRDLSNTYVGCVEGEREGEWKKYGKCVVGVWCKKIGQHQRSWIKPGRLLDRISSFKRCVYLYWTFFDCNIHMWPLTYYRADVIDSHCIVAHLCVVHRTWA